MAGESKAALYKASDEENAEPLRDMTGDNYTLIPALLPGERRHVRLRWDPVDNSGDYAIEVVADTLHALVESDKTNNTATTSINVRTKSKLKPGELMVARGEGEGEIMLLAEVANLGETAARRVTVNFYKSEEQTDENKIAEVLVDRVPPEETVDALYRWQIDLEEEDLSELNPTFTVALKGSQMRVSSVAEESDESGEDEH